MVATATHTLCEAANSAVQGQASEERLIAAAKAVSKSTAQLLLACRVKADANSETQRRLQVCLRHSQNSAEGGSWGLVRRRVKMRSVMSVKGGGGGG